MNYLNDMHVHTSDSPDATIPAWQLAQLAVDNRIASIGFVAHVDLNPEDYCYGGFDAETYDESINRAGIASRGRISVMKGLEVGEPHTYEKRVKSIVDYSDYDFIIGSLHSVDGIGMVLGKEVFADGDPREIVEAYYTETLRMVTVSDMDILGHLGLFRRGLALAGLDYTFDETDLWSKTIRRILETIIERNIALELNTSGLRRKEKMTYPTPKVLELYRKMGGQLITIGSDTHREPHVFFGLDQGIELLTDMGFSENYTFRNRIPHKFDLT